MEIRSALDQRIENAFLSIALGDALGLPVEFQSRERLRQKPVETMEGFGAWNQMPGTFSDDSSLTFCTAEALLEGFDLRRMGKYFSSWRKYGFWAAHDFAFDIGSTTLKGIQNIEKGIEPQLAGGDGERDNGNGSLMRILPMAFFNLNHPIEERFDKVKKVSSLTHRHIRSVIACFYYTEFARELILGKSKTETYQNLQNTIPDFLKSQNIAPAETEIFMRLLKMNIAEYPEEEILSSGYVLDTLEASVWCLMNRDNYADTLLTAVNLGGDTDTTAAVTGGLAGLVYLAQSIPQSWLDQLARRKDIVDLAHRFYRSLG